MLEYKTCHKSVLEERKSVTFDLNDRSVGVILAEGKLYAYENVCSHAGGPVCLGGIFGKIELQLNESKKVEKEYVSMEQLHLVCPWHGLEYDLKTGKSVFNTKYKLKKYEVRIKEDEYVYVDMD